MSDFKTLDEKYLVEVNEKCNWKALNLWPREKLIDLILDEDKIVSVSEAFKLAEENRDKNWNFWPLESAPIECFFDGKDLNDQLGYMSDRLTEYVVARETKRNEPFRAEEGTNATDRTIKMLNVLFGFEKYNPEDDLFLEKMNESNNILKSGPADCCFERQYLEMKSNEFCISINNREDDSYFVNITIDNEDLIAQCVIIDKGNGSFFIDDLRFVLPEFDSEKPYIEYYKLGFSKYIVKLVLDFVVASGKCLKGIGLIDRIEMRVPKIQKHKCPETPEEVSAFLLADSIIEWFDNHHCGLKYDSYLPECNESLSEVINASGFEEKIKSQGKSICRYSIVSKEEDDDFFRYVLKYKNLPETWTRKETEMFLPYYSLGGRWFEFPSYCSKRIAKGSFKNLETIRELFFPDNIVEIEDGAFENCSSLLSVTIGENTKCGENAFINCKRSFKFYDITNTKRLCFYSLRTSDATLYIDVTGETERRFGKLLLLATNDEYENLPGIPFVVCENPEIAFGTEEEIINWKEFFDSGFEATNLNRIKEFIRNNLDLLLEAGHGKYFNKGKKDFNALNEMKAKLSFYKPKSY